MLNSVVSTVTEKLAGLTQDAFQDGALPKSSYALLVIDLQESFRSMYTDQVRNNIQKLIQKCRKDKVPIIFTQHGYYNLENDAGAAFRLFGSHGCVLVNSKGYQLMPEADYQPSKGDVLVHKHRYDSFYETNLNALLKATGARTVVITGLTTNLCCESTARSAFMRDYDVIMISDACNTETQELHEASLKQISFGFGKVLTTNDVMKKF